VESALRNGVDLIVLGWGVKWMGLSQKLEAAYRYAASIPPHDVLLFTDAFDVMFTNNARYIMETFSSMKTDLMFAAECGCWPHVMEEKDVCFSRYPPSPTPYRYLNSGTWIGNAKSAMDMLGVVIQKAGNNFMNANDQKLIADMYLSQEFNIQLDFRCKLFQSMHMTLDPPLAYCDPVTDITVVDGKFLNKRTNNFPAVFHFNGGGKSHHLNMEKKMWYKDPSHHTLVNWNELGNKVVKVPTASGGGLKFREICTDYYEAEKTILQMK